MYMCVGAYEEMTHKHTHKPSTHACIHVPTCTRTHAHTRTVRRVSLNFLDQSQLRQVFAPRIVLHVFSLKRFLACTRESKVALMSFVRVCVLMFVLVIAFVCVCHVWVFVCMYNVHSDSSAMVVDHENHRVQFWDKDGTWLRSIGICVVSRECAQIGYAYKF